MSFGESVSFGEVVVGMSPASVDGERARARIEAHRLVRRIQSDPVGVTPPVMALTAQADRSGWLDVAVVARLASVVSAFVAGRIVPDAHVERMVADGEASGDPAVRALALGARARVRFAGRAPAAAAAADVDLAGATVLLEAGVGAALERRLAHVQCATGFGSRGFWELELRSYGAALLVDTVAEEPELAGHETELAGSDLAIINNMAETQASWAVALRAAGDADGTARRCAAARAAVDRAITAGLPESWLRDLAATRLLVDALVGRDVTPAAAGVLAGVAPRSAAAGLVHLALALSLQSSDTGGAGREADAAVGILRAGDYRAELDLAMHVAVEVEGAPAGIRLARHLAARLWADREVARTAMEAMIRSERLRTTNLVLDRHAHVDDLTGLANRRGYQRFRQRLMDSDSPQVAVMLVDLDRFKEVNDRYGHGVGDRALTRAGAVMAAHVRPGDLAARLGGDEFVVVFDRTPLDVAAVRAAEVIDALQRPGGDDTAGQDVPLSASVGLAVGHPGDLDQLGIDADAALYRAKALGGGRWVAAGPLR